jgi:hypothetical protein
VTVALRLLTVALRNDQMQVVFCMGHGHLEQATPLDLGGDAGPEVRRHAAVDDVQQIDRLPLLAFAE